MALWVCRIEGLRRPRLAQLATLLLAAVVAGSGIAPAVESANAAMFQEDEASMLDDLNRPRTNSSRTSDVSPGHGQCFGVWTLRWKQTVGPIPNRVMDHIRISGNPYLLERIRRNECPFGTALPGQVTWPSPPRELSDVVNPLGWLQIIMVIWSYMPYAVAFHGIIRFIIVRGTRESVVLLWLVIFMCFNEVVAKQVISQPRPGVKLNLRTYNGKYVGSCLESCGMPSSHAGLTMGLFLLIFLDASFRVNVRPLPRPRQPGLERCRGTPLEGGERRNPKRRDTAKEQMRLELTQWQKTFVQLLDIIIPWRYHASLDHEQFVLYIIWWFMVLVPAGMARIVLYDHTTEQVLTGKFAGCALSLIWWRIVRRLQRLNEHRVGDYVCCGLLVHNLPLQEHVYTITDTSDDSDHSYGRFRTRTSLGDNTESGEE